MPLGRKKVLPHYVETCLKEEQGPCLQTFTDLGAFTHCRWDIIPILQTVTLRLREVTSHVLSATRALTVSMKM